MVHRWGGNNEADFWPDLKEKLKNSGEVISLNMPNTEEPTISEWVNFLKESIGKANEQTHFIGHSIGCQTIMRFLEQENTKVGNLYFVAPWFTLQSLEDEESESTAKPWLETEIDLEKVKSSVNKIKVFLSKDDEFVEFEENRKKFVEMGAEIFVFEDKGHFTDEEGVIELPELVEEILKDIK